MGAQAVAEGRIDGVGIARQFLADGEWITKLIEDRLEDIRPCICCHNGCFTMTHYKGIANTKSFRQRKRLSLSAAVSAVWRQQLSVQSVGIT